MKMAERVESKESYNDMIFRYIRAYKNWLSAHILQNRLEYKNDVTQKKVEAKEATDLKVKRKIYLEKRVNTQRVPSYNAWCTGRMSKATSKTR